MSTHTVLDRAGTLVAAQDAHNSALQALQSAAPRDPLRQTLQDTYNQAIQGIASEQLWQAQELAAQLSNYLNCYRDFDPKW